MSQKKKVRVYQPGGQMGNPMANWFMQMGGVPQQPQQDDMMNQIMVYAQQMIMQGEDPNYVYDDLVTQGVPSQIAAQVVEQIVDSMPPQPSYSQPTTAEAMYNQEVEEEEEAGPDFMDLAGLYDDEDDDDFEDFKKGGMTKKKFVKEYKKLALGGEKPEEVSKIKSAGFLGAVENTFKNAKAEQEAEQMFNNPFAVNALSQFVYGGSLPKANDGGGAGTFANKEDFDKYVKEQAERYKQLEDRYGQLERRYNQGYMNNAYGYGYGPGYGYGRGYGYGPGYGYGRGYGYGNVPTMFNPYGRREPIFQRTPYFKNFPGAEFAGMQLSEFKINPAEQIDRKGLFKFLGPKTQQTWSATWSRNPVTGKTEPAKPGTTTTPETTTSPAAPSTPTTPPAQTPAPAATPPATSEAIATYGPQSTPDPPFRTSVDYLDPRYQKSYEEQGIIDGEISDENLDGFYFPNNTPARFDFVTGKFIEIPKQKYGGYRFQPGGSTRYQKKSQVIPPPEIMSNPFDPSPYNQRYQEQMDAHPFYRDYINKIKAGEDVTDEERDRAEFLFDQGLQPIDDEMMSAYNTQMEQGPNTITKEDKVKNAWTVDIPALYDDTMYYAKNITGALDEERNKRNYLAIFLDNATRGNEEYGFRGNYTTNQLSNSSNFRPDLDGQIQYSQYGGSVIGRQVEMTDEEIKKFLKGGGKLRYV